jgi:hypothetical protein
LDSQELALEWKVPQLPFFCEQFVLRTLDAENVSAALTHCLEQPKMHRVVSAASKHYFMEDKHLELVEKSRTFQHYFEENAHFRSEVACLYAGMGRDVRIDMNQIM